MKTFGAVFIAAVFLACIQSSQVSHGAGANTVVKVSATVLPYVKLQAHQRVAVYRVTAEDLERGYVDLPDCATVRIRSNESRTIAVTVSNAGPEQIMVKETGRTGFYGTDGTIVIGRPQAGLEMTKNLDLRLILPKGAREGFYALNIAINPYSF